MKHFVVFVWFIAFFGAAVAQEDLKQAKDKSCPNLCQSKKECASSIAGKIQNYWAMPPGYTNENILIVLNISLDLDGSIKSASVDNGGQYKDLETSVLRAVKRAGKFCEIEGLPSEDVETYFGNFQVAFRTQTPR